MKQIRSDNKEYGQFVSTCYARFCRVICNCDPDSNFRFKISAAKKREEGILIYNV